MSWSLKSASWGTSSLVGAALLAGPAFADGLPSRSKVSAPTGPCTISGSVGVTSDYVFRGISQTLENPAAQGGLEFACGKFYLGFAASNIDFGIEGTLEFDVYGGYKFTTGKIGWDVGFIYYSYPGINTFFDADYLELKVAASAEIWKGGTVGATVFYSPEYTFNTGAVATYEVTFSQTLPRVSIFSPTFSATYGYSDFLDFGFLSYDYWNAGVALGFLEKWTLDLRYWDSENVGFAAGPLGEERFVATLKYSF
jgi:uncharacterized protein (TIGR02001 family)